jgi:hypothetical protein
MADESKTFDQTAVDLARAFVGQVLIAIPELRSVAVVFDFKGDLNQGVDSIGVWNSRDGHDLADAVGMSGQMTRMLQTAANRIAEAVDRRGQEAAQAVKFYLQETEKAKARYDEELARVAQIAATTPESPPGPSVDAL